MFDSRVNSTNLPTELGMLTEMTRFQIWSTLADGGTIPTEFGNCKQLELLHIEGNSIDGPIPTELATLSNLSRLILQTQTLTGSLPSELGLLTGLEWLKVARNELRGTLPTELGNLKELSSKFG
ncbi:MAG: hypothetical protein SGILL_010039, partial [Bacillariaceae sp.]